MSIRIVLDLSDEDLTHFRTMARQAQKAAETSSESEVVRGAEKLLAEVPDDGGSSFIGERLGKLGILIEMVRDKGFHLPKEDRSRVLSALAYFNNPEDLIPDHIPGLGFLDDAIMVELICRDLRHEIDAYRDFCRYRESEASHRGVDPASVERADFLEARRKQLISRMRRRRRRDFGGSGGARSPFSLF